MRTPSLFLTALSCVYPVNLPSVFHGNASLLNLPSYEPLLPRNTEIFRGPRISHELALEDRAARKKNYCSTNLRARAYANEDESVTSRNLGVSRDLNSAMRDNRSR